MDEAELGVCPVELLLLEVDGQSVGPIDLVVYDDLSIGAIHSRPLYSRLLPPVGPIHVPEKKRGQSAGFHYPRENKVKSSQPVIQTTHRLDDENMQFSHPYLQGVQHAIRTNALKYGRTLSLQRFTY